MKRGLLIIGLAGCFFAAAGPASATGPPRDVELVVTLKAPPLARAIASSRVLTAQARRERLDLRFPTSVGYRRELAAAQRVLAARITRTIPNARIRWRYEVVLNGLAVVVPAELAGRLAAVPGVARVYPSIRYRARLDRSPGQIGAPTLWGPGSTTGQGVKIGILDDGVDQTHPFFDPRGFAMPAGFPKGNTAFTTAKVIAARAFPPPTPSWRHAAKPFDPENSEHGTHVAGIAAGNRGVVPTAGRSPVSGVAPGAYIGNYKVLTIPTPEVGLDGNSPEIAAGIEAAVKDGMDVINLSLGEPEIEPSRDLVVQAINAAADAGVVPTIAAGNDFSDFGFGSVGSPGSAAKAITAAAVWSGRNRPTGVVTSFSSGGPTPVSLQLKPDVSAPGGEILSSVPAREGSWAIFSGTSMAAPHVAGSAALLRQRHPTWTAAQVKSALVQTGDRALTDGASGEAATTRGGGGRINLARANEPLIFAEPVSISFGVARGGGGALTRTIALTDAGGGVGVWTVQVAQQTSDPRVAVTAPASVAIPGSLDAVASVASGAPQQSYTGFIVLTRGETVRRIPYWLDVAAPTLGRHRATPLRRPGTYRGNTAGRPSLVSTYRYPTSHSRLGGPEQVYRVRLARPVANFGVAILSRAAGVEVQARIVSAGDENHQVGYASLPLNLNPYLADFGEPRDVSGALRPARGDYDIVFDSASAATAGRFTFRFWINDARPPAIRLLPRPTRTTLALRVTDGASGVDPESLVVTVDGQIARWRLQGSRLVVPIAGLRVGRHRLAVQASDFQETRNNENVLRILPNTRRFSTSFTVR